MQSSFRQIDSDKRKTEMNEINYPLEVQKILNNSKIILVAAIGGGCDILGCMPIFYDLKKINKEIVLSDVFLYNLSDKLTESKNHPGIFYAKNDISEFDSINAYKAFPEGFIRSTVNMLPRTGVKDLTRKYQYIVDNAKIDTIIAVDCGVDSLMKGTEIGLGTYLDDLLSVIAIDQVNVKNKILICNSFGTEIEEKLNHEVILQNINELVKQDALYGIFSLNKIMDCYKFYKAVCDKAFQYGSSHIHPRLIKAIEGEQLSNFQMPFMNIWWCFDFHKVAIMKAEYKLLMHTLTFDEVKKIHRSFVINRSQNNA